MIHTWRTLSQWIDESEEELSFVAEVQQAAELWDRRGRRAVELWQGDGLSDALRTAARCNNELPAVVAEFLTAGRDNQLRKQRRRRGAIIAALVGLSLIAVE